MSAIAFFEWCESTALGTAIRESIWYFPVIEGVHLVALAMLGGSALLVDLRLLGALMPRVPLAQVARDARPYLLGSIAVIIVTGLLLFMSEAVKCFYNTSFWVKMSALLLALIFLFAVKQPVAMRDEAKTSPAVLKTVGGISIALWFVVAAAGRWIGFS